MSTRPFAHLHCHTQFSLLDGASKISSMLDKAAADGMPAAAITDHGNMFGVFEFVNEANKRNLKPLVGCEFYVVEDRHKKQFTKTNRDKRYHQLFLAKDPEGYKNLSKLCSLGFVEGLYSKFPRIDKELILQYHEGLIATTCCIGAEVPQTILNKGEEAGEEVFKWWLDLFGDDYYIELQRHHIDNIDGTGISQEAINQTLVKWSKKHNVKMIATNDSHYIDQDDSNAHDILLCVNTGDLQSELNRFKFFNDQFYFKSQAEMSSLFKDLPQTMDTTIEIVDKITPPQLKRDVLLPNYALPPEFSDMNVYLRHLSYAGAKAKYGELAEVVTARLEYELNIIKDMGFAGYFLIVQDFIQAARDMSVRVGPGRGSAAGSLIAYCIGITNVDPIHYNLLFERFLNPERVSMPDIDIDFDDDGRQRVIDYVIKKYGQNQVAQIVTFGTMAARSSIRDVARVLDLPLPEADKIAKLIPPNPGMNFEKAFKEVPELVDIKKNTNVQGETLRMAEKLEGSVRHTGLHAAGVIIAPEDLMNCIPVCTSKDAELWVTQFDGKYIEDAGMLKMDFLGLKTLSILNDAVALVKERHQIDIEPEEFSLEDEKTFELFQRGDTVGVFQFESQGMQKYLKQLKPTNIEDLIAMNALYRPGPMDYIPEFIDRKHGRKKVEYPHELLEEILKPTYGIMVYQEQIMKTAQIIGGFSLGKADLMRKAMGKKKMDIMEKQKVEFIDGAAEKGIDKKQSADIFDTMKEFAKYGFNRSHSVAYSVLAYQTAYLKANYLPEYMAAVLTHNMSDVKSISFFLKESRRLGVPVLGPDVNESNRKFRVNEKGAIRFALTGIKGVGSSAVEELVRERTAAGSYSSIFDLTKRVDLKSVNRKCLENLAIAGAFDCFEKLNRAQYVHTVNGSRTLIEDAIKFGNSYKNAEASAQGSLFGDMSMIEIKEPDAPVCAPWTLMEKLKREKDITGIYMSGHPLDDYMTELESFCSHRISEVEDNKERELRIAGIVTESAVRVSKKGNRFANFSIEDFDGTLNLAIFGEDFLKFRHFIEEPGLVLYVAGKYQKNRFNDNYDFRIHSIDLLSSVKEKLTKGVKVLIDEKIVDRQFIQSFGGLLQAHPGDLPLKIVLHNGGADSAVGLVSKKFKINGSNEFFKALRNIADIRFELTK